MAKSCYLYNSRFKVVKPFGSIDYARRFQSCHVGWERVYYVDAKRIMAEGLSEVSRFVCSHPLSSSSLYSYWSMRDIISWWMDYYGDTLAFACEETYREGLEN